MEKNIKIFLDKSQEKNQEKKLPLQQPEHTMDAFKTGKINVLANADKKKPNVFTRGAHDKTFRNLIEKMNEGAVMLNEYGTILYCNSFFANLVNVPLQKVIGEEFKNFINQPLKRRFGYLLKKSKGQAVKEEINLHTGDQKIIPMLMSVNTFMLNHISISGIILTDLTIQNKNKEELGKANNELHENAQLLQKQAKKLKAINNDLLRLNTHIEERVSERTSELETLNFELKHLNLAKDKFLRAISHNLQNPLTALLISADLLSSQIEDEIFNGIRPFVKIIDRTSHNILGQLNELVAWTKMQQSKIPLNPEKICLVRGVDKFLESLKDIAAKRSVTIQNNIPDKICVIADNLTMKFVFQKLVTNAINYTKENGVVTITAQLKEKMVEVCITNSGIGMKADVSKNLFINYKSLSMPGSDSEKGTGLGLIPVKDFIVQNGGTIRIKSGSGKGTKIFFTLPLG